MRTQITVSGVGQNVAGYIGEIAWFADSILRKNHVWADGAPIDAEQWPELAEYAAEAGWEQNEDGQYLTPDLSGRVLISASETHAVGTSGGEEEHTLTVSEMPAHEHSLYYGSYAAPGTDIVAGSSGDGSFQKIVQSTGGGLAHNIMQPYYTAKAQIRTKVDRVVAYVPGATEVAEEAQATAEEANAKYESIKDSWIDLHFVQGSNIGNTANTIKCTYNPALGLASFRGGINANLTQYDSIYIGKIDTGKILPQTVYDAGVGIVSSTATNSARVHIDFREGGNIYVSHTNALAGITVLFFNTVFTNV